MGKTGISQSRDYKQSKKQCSAKKHKKTAISDIRHQEFQQRYLFLVNVFSRFTLHLAFTTRIIFLRTTLLALVQVSADSALGGSNASEDTGTETDSLPVELALLVQAPALVAEVCTETDDGSEVGNNKTGGVAVGQLGELLDEPVVGLLGLCGGGFTLSLLLLGLLLALYAGSLGLGLDLLLEEVSGDSVHARHVDIDQRGGGGRLVRDDLGRLRGSSLGGVSIDNCEYRN